MRMNLEHPDLAKVNSVLLDGHRVLVVEADDEEGFVIAYLHETEDRPARVGEKVRCEADGGVLTRFEGQVTIVMNEAVS